MEAILHTVQENPFELKKSVDIPSFLHTFQPEFCHDIVKYKKVAKIGQGTYGVVYKAHDRNKGNKATYVALKKILTFGDMDGFPLSALREIKILKSLQHPNIIRLIEVCRKKTADDLINGSGFYLVFDFCEHDLAGLLSNRKIKLTIAEIKCVLLQLLKAISFIHKRNIIHRDVKTSNILLTKSGVVKLGDFGLARTIDPKSTWKAHNANKENVPNHKQKVKRKNEKHCYTNLVVTLWYRSPELLLGETNYGPEVDMWSVGCIVGEMWTRTALMPGKNEQHQLIQITNLCGSLTTTIWPEIVELELYNKIKLPQNCIRKLKHHLRPHIRDLNALDLLDKLLTLDPSKRMNAMEALGHKFIKSGVIPVSLSSTLAKHPESMYTQSSEVIAKFASSSQTKSTISRRLHVQQDDACTSFQDLIF